MAGELLDLNHAQYMDRNTDELLQECDAFGLTLFGDGATVKKAPLLNVLASGAYLPSVCLEIVNCSKHMAEGGKKDAKYIASRFDPYITKYETHSPHVVDLVIFDGASNVQKAGDVLQAKWNRLSVIHGAEHVMSLFFGDLFKRSELQVFVNVCRQAYQLFGSGSMHKPYAIFSNYAQKHNSG